MKDYTVLKLACRNYFLKQRTLMYDHLFADLGFLLLFGRFAHFQCFIIYMFYHIHVLLLYIFL